MTRAKVRRWTRTAHPNPWEYRVPSDAGMIHGTRPTWQQAIARALQLIADQT